MEPFKNIFNKKSTQKLAENIQKFDKKFDSKAFQKAVIKQLETRELKERVELITSELHKYLTGNYKTRVKNLTKCLSQKLDHNTRDYLEDGIQGFLVWPLAYYIQCYGIEDLHTSLAAMEEMTKRFTAEFAIRPFLQEHYQETFKVLKNWKKSENYHVRRLVSEGTRPKLPWAIKVPKIHNNLKNNIQLIYALRLDESEYVRRSVANHLNDISYLDQDLFFETIERMGETEKEKWVKRHAGRSLLKKGHPRALKIYGYDPNLRVDVKLKLSSKQIKEGDKFTLDVKLKSTASKKSKILIEYCIHYLKKNGQYSKKPFRLRDTYIEGELNIEKPIHFKKVTTRVHYPGKHFIEIQVNGKSYKKTSFTLLE